MLNQEVSSGQIGKRFANAQRTSPPPARVPFLLFIGSITVVLWAITALTGSVNAAPQFQTVPPAQFLLSAGHRGEAETDDEQVFYRDEDIVSFSATGELEIFFDGSAHGLGPVDLEDFEVFADGSFIFTVNRRFDLPNPNDSPDPLEIDDSDIVLYTPSTDSYSIYLSGAAIGLTKGNEDIDALALAPDGRLLISTIGKAKVNDDDEVKAKDEDLLVCTVFPPADPPDTPTCELYFDGSDVELTKSREDVMAASVDTNGDLNHYLTTKGRFKAEGSASSLDEDRDVIFGCTPLSLDDTTDLTDCFLFSLFDAEDIDWENQIDGLWINFTGSPLPPLPGSDDTMAANASEADEAIDADDYAEAMAEADDDVDEFDFMDVVQQFYLPIVNR
jgi:hypothetical protein